MPGDMLLEIEAVKRGIGLRYISPKDLKAMLVFEHAKHSPDFFDLIQRLTDLIQGEVRGCIFEPLDRLES